ncbi:Tm-1-like ATP-binding domain-containing protein [Actinomadura parmotrematis]|uniref:Tm-1-like ATP-binding domain-containing protein n=1 Tax=Actinomadura parmotrematis TaxID=2864039 RepID=A0ABS7G3Y3_9ACTN|nr:Tm-1-like ATP-binding domain-containing protein [Actinomadura parmotrematis]MBW8486945.1 Tm-1-like ATP-binding domain-containing protein [Actinomadura parmotrematis]
MAYVVLLGTLDTKGAEYGWLRDRLRGLGADVVLVDTGTRGAPRVVPDVPREEVARAAGLDLAAQDDRGAALTAMAGGAAAVLVRLHRRGRLHGVLSVGGSGNSALSTAAMRALPVGVPKLMVSSMASGDVSPYVGGSDLTLMYSVVDVAGINRVSARVLANAADAIAGMAAGYAAGRPAVPAGWPVVGATMAGVTTRGVDAARDLLDGLGYEVLVFHASGAGGRSFEAMAGSGALAGVLDATLLEVSTALLGGVGRAGPERLESAGRAGVPQVVGLGALDMGKFGPSVPERLRGRHVHMHNAAVAVVRTTPAECAELGRLVAGKLRAATGPAAVYLPLRGLSTLGLPGGPYHRPDADAALFDAVREGLAGSPVEVHELDTDANDPAFGLAMATRLHAMLAPAAVPLTY